jgi:G3E family GTPase
MKFVIISGFLGSGKTTLLLGLVKTLSSADNLDFVILENEIGEIGLDGEYLKRRGLTVKELYSGCVCCQLSGDLVVMLREIKAALDPDCVFLEASGLARVESILETLDRYAADLEKPLVLSLADLERSELYIEEPIPFMINQIKHADLVILNKTDRGDNELAEIMEKKLREINPQAETVRVSSLDGTNLDRVAERVGEWIRKTS